MEQREQANKMITWRAVPSLKMGRTQEENCNYLASYKTKLAPAPLVLPLPPLFTVQWDFWVKEWQTVNKTFDGY